ncbi:programmed cell death protein 2-like protein [Leptotrombidium deliense]|uniref:Programmed cell death protein 2-like protein n=1 Tax=Leptotrombidium deliense TaxID=299467 RepID=A0A443SN11_9ACAR|nr:programmed cell death protein 2-like protein [Leptotrombidium deliense]
MEKRVDLGFVEDIDDLYLFKLKSKYFPSKVGGKPSWLSLTHLPSSEQLKCELCSHPLILLLQIYCPIDDLSTAFHRTIFIFCCVQPNCGGGFKVFRSQLKRFNAFYDSEPPDYEAVEEKLDYDPKPENFGVKLCSVCGCFADKICSACKEVTYCSREHQKFDWKQNGHKELCGRATSNGASSALLKEFELVIETENGSEDNRQKDNVKTEAQRMQECIDFINQRKPSCQDENFDEYENNCIKDDIYDNFRRKTKQNADQVIRYYSYDRKNDFFDPLWINNEKPATIPNCENCGSQRKIECQIMPQLLYFVGGADKSVDFGTLLIYSCIESCDAKDENIAYLKEYVFIQNFKQ